MISAATDGISWQLKGFNYVVKHIMKDIVRILETIENRRKQPSGDYPIDQDQ